MPGEDTSTAGPSRARHIVDAMSDLKSQGSNLPGAPRLTHAVPVPRSVDQGPLPVPRSTFSTYATFQPKCGHITMTRVYHLGYRCERCNRHGPFGWLYRCTEHRELILDDMHRRGFKVSLAEPKSLYGVEQGYDIDSTIETAFDSIGESFCGQMSLGQWGPDKRQERYSALREMTQEQLHTYTPQQIATILAQRDNVRPGSSQDILSSILANVRRKVWKTAENQMRSPQHSRGRAPVRWSLGADPLVSAGNLLDAITDEVSPGRPWVPRMREECTFKACHHCYRRAAEKAWLSLNGIVNGDINPTAATAYSFHSFQARPVCKASVVGNLGYRAVPLPRRSQSVQGIIDLTPSDAAGSVELVGYDQDECDADSDSEWVTTDDDSSDSSDHDDEDDDGGGCGGFPWAIPLPTGPLRRSVPLSKLRKRLASTITQSNVHPQAEPAVKARHLEYRQSSVDSMGHLPGQLYERCIYHSMEAVARLASDIPLPGPTFEEELFSNEEMKAGKGADEHEAGDNHFGSEPPRVPGGIAVREEAEEAGLADIVTQV